MKEKIQRLKTFLLKDLWDVDFNALSFAKRLGLGSIKVAFIVVRGFGRDKCPLHASALTYITLMSMVPMVAMMFSVAKGFGGGVKLEALVTEQTAQLPENVTEFINRMLALVENTNFGVLGAIGVLLLFYTVIAMMGKIERSFNSIWGILNERTFFRKFSDYVSVLLVVPLLILAATSLNASLNSNSFVLLLQEKVPYFADLYGWVAKFTGTLFVWIAFTLVFVFMPNTQVKALPALIGGVIAGTLWQLLQWAYIHLQIGVSKYNAIYGTFASIPIFLAWLYLCWLIVLFGCEVAFAVQNFKTYEEEGVALDANQSTREALAVAMFASLARQYAAGNGPWNLVEYASKHMLPIRLSRDIFQQLEEAKVVLRAGEDAKLYVPGAPLDKIKVTDIHAAMRGQASEALIKRIDLPEYTKETDLGTLAQGQKDGGSYD